jgi:hypothetical protein
MSEEWPGQAVQQPAEQWPGQAVEGQGPATTEADWLAHPERGFKAPSVPISGMPGFTGPDGIAVAKNVYPSLGPILSAMGHGAKDGWGDEPLGLSPESVEWLSKKGIFGPEKGGYDNPFQAFNELAAHAVVGAVQVASKTFSAAQGVVAEGLDAAGMPSLGRDIAAMPEAFFGSPHPMGIPKELPITRADLEAPLPSSSAPKVSLERKPSEEMQFPNPETKTFSTGLRHRILDADGDPIGMVDVEPKNGGKTLEIVWIGTEEGSSNRLNLGPSQVRSLYKDLIAAYPDAENITGYRIGGAHTAATADINMPITREPGALPPAVAEARDLGVIGPPRPDVSSLAPAARASEEVPAPAAARATQAQPGRPPAPEKAGNIRLDQIGINADAKDVILDAAKNNDDFNQARQGNVPLAQVESLSGASGVPSEVLTGNDGLGRLMHNDAVVRTWLQAFHQASDEIAGQMATVARTGDETDVEKLRDMTLRFQHMQEQVSGLTAEAGRTLGVFREFYANKGKAEAIGKLLEDNPGLDADSLKKLADAGKGLEKDQVPRFLHDSRQPTFWDKYLYYWVNALISGPVTHLKYIGANAAFGAYEAGVVTPIAGALGTVRRLTGGEGGVYTGEAAARMWGLLAGTPDALKAAWTAAKNNVMTPFENEVAGKAVNPLTQTRPSPIGGKLGFAIGIPGRSAAGIHSFFRFLGYRAEIEAQAYRAAAKEGLSPLGQQFWERRGALADQPTEAMMNAGIENGNHLTFISEPGWFGTQMGKLANSRIPGESGIQPFKLILPFTHIPGQILRAGLEQTPAAFADSRMRADLLGKNGAVAADTARARLIAGGAVSAYVANLAMNDTLTGYGPTDPTERAQWLRTHEPYSVRLGGWWYSYNKFGPIGDVVGLVSNLVEVGPKVGEGEYAEAAGHVLKATSRMLEDEVGMQGLVNLLDAMSDPDRKMSQFVAGQATSNLPYSSLLRQTASFNDPYMREAKNFVDELRYAIPWARQDLLPKRDWLGQPMDNPGYQSIIRQRAVNADPVDLAVSQLRGFKPAPPQARIGGVALPPKLYDEYQTTAGAMARAGLETVVRSPGWGEMPPGIREQIVHSMVEKARQTAGSILQAKHPELIIQGVKDRQDKISGVKPTKLSD